MLEVKQATVVVIPFGPFVSPSDGFTPDDTLVAALDNGTTGIKLSKNGAPLAVRHAAVAASVSAGQGQYLVTLDATDTADLGMLRLTFPGAAGYAPVVMDFEVITVEEWDRKYGLGLSVADVPGAIMTTVYEGGETLQDFLRLVRAFAIGQSTNFSGIVTFKALNGSTVRISAVTDANGQRTSVSVDPA